MKDKVIFSLLLILFLIVLFPWTHFDDINALTISANTFLFGVSPYQYGVIYLPTVVALVFFFSLFGTIWPQIFEIRHFPPVLNQITFTPIALPYFIYYAKFITIILYVLIIYYAYQIFKLFKLHNLFLRYYILNPILLLVAVIMVKPDEFLTALSILIVVYILLRSSYSTITSLDIILLSFFSIMPFVSRLHDPFLWPLVFIYTLLHRNSKKYVAIIFILPLIFILLLFKFYLDYLHILSSTGIILNVRVPGFYSPFVISRVYITDFLAALEELYYSHAVYLYLGVESIAFMLAAYKILKNKDKDISPILAYIIVSASAPLLTTPAVLTQYLVSPVTVLPFLLFYDHSKNINIKIKFVLTYLFFISYPFILYEVYNLPLSYVIFVMNKPPDLFINLQVRWMNGEFWSPYLQGLLMPSYYAGVVLWLFTMVGGLKLLLTQKERKEVVKVDNTVSYIPGLFIFILVVISLLYFLLVYQFNLNIFPFFKKVDNLRLQVLYSKYYYNLSFIIDKNVLININNLTDVNYYGSFSYSNFLFFKYIDVPSQLARFDLKNSTRASYKIFIGYSENYKNLTGIINKLKNEYNIIIVAGPFIYNSTCFISVEPYPDLFLYNSSIWRSAVRFPIYVSNCNVLYNDSLITIINLSGKNNSSTILLSLRTMNMLPVFVFGSKYVSEDVALATLFALNYTSINYHNCKVNIFLQSIPWYIPYRWVAVYNLCH